MVSRAGSRKPNVRTGFGRVPGNRISWVRTWVTKQLSLAAMDPGDYDEEQNYVLSSEEGTAYVITAEVPGRTRPLNWNLSAMTMEELNVFEAFFVNAINLARPVVELRDKVAADALAEGDDSFSRVYRETPVFVVREKNLSTESNIDSSIHATVSTVLSGGLAKDEQGQISTASSEPESK